MKELDIQKNRRIRVTFCAYREWALKSIQDVIDKSDIDVVDVIKSKEEYKEIVLNYVGRHVDCIVFVGWNWIIQADILNRFVCVGMYPSDLPMYRGGSPIQHQIMDGLEETRISLMSISPEGIDAGDVWCKEKWKLTGNTMSEILGDLTESTTKLLCHFFEEFDNIIPEKQDLTQGSYYKRRKPIESRVTWKQLEKMGLNKAYNFIRALGDPYPNAYIEDQEGNILKLKEVELVVARQKKKVSIIVPVFNMEKLLEKCIDSILCQSYINIQIIIVDDGSQDRSGEVADKYAMQDDRISVIHHPINRGIACGFRTGLDVADGDFIVFVDSDNTISDVMIEKLLKYQKQYNADVVQCEAVCYKTDDEIHLYSKESNLIGEIVAILKDQDIRQDFLHSKTITNNLSAKLFKRSLFSEIEIPEGKQIVDIIILPQILKKSRRYVCVTDKLYYAYMPDDSVSRRAISNWRIDDLIYENKFYERFINENWKECRQYIPYHKILTSLWAYNKILLVDNIDDKDKHLDYFYNIIKNNFMKAKKGKYYKDIVMKDRIRLLILLTSRTVYNMIIEKRHL